MMNKFSRRKALFILLGGLFTSISFSATKGQVGSFSHGLGLMHNVLSRAINVMLKHIEKSNQSGFVESELDEGFVTYANRFLAVFFAHHDGEELILFPIIKAKVPSVDFTQLLEQHKVMHHTAEKFSSLVNKKNLSSESYNEIYSLIQNMSQQWKEHRQQEEDTIIHDDIGSAFPLNEQIILGEKLSKHGQAHSKPVALTLPFMLYNLEPDEREEFSADMPWILTSFLIPVVWKSKWKIMEPFLLD